MIKIRKFKKSDAKNASKLVAITYAQFNNREGNKKDVQNYIDHFDPKKTPLKVIEQNFCSSKICFVALDNDKIIGVVRGGLIRVSNLFVNGKYHGQGIGKRLMTKFETEAKKLGSEKIKIRASLYAVPFYKKMDYKKTGGERKIFGLRYIPMKKILK